MIRELRKADINKVADIWLDTNTEKVEDKMWNRGRGR